MLYYQVTTLYSCCLSNVSLEIWYSVKTCPEFPISHLRLIGNTEFCFFPTVFNVSLLISNLHVKALNLIHTNILFCAAFITQKVFNLLTLVILICPPIILRTLFSKYGSCQLKHGSCHNSWLIDAMISRLRKTKIYDHLHFCLQGFLENIVYLVHFPVTSSSLPLFRFHVTCEPPDKYFPSICHLCFLWSFV